MERNGTFLFKCSRTLEFPEEASVVLKIQFAKITLSRSQLNPLRLFSLTDSSAALIKSCRVFIERHTVDGRGSTETC